MSHLCRWILRQQSARRQRRHLLPRRFQHILFAARSARINTDGEQAKAGKAQYLRLEAIPPMSLQRLPCRRQLHKLELEDADTLGEVREQKASGCEAMGIAAVLDLEK